MEVYNTHKFLFTLMHEGRIKGHRVVFIDRDNKEKEIVLDRIEIGTSPVSCKLFCENEERYLVPFIRIKKVYWKNELVWDATDSDQGDVRIIKGYD